MKLASIKPFVGTPEVDIEREIVTQEVRQQRKSVTAVNEEVRENEVETGTSEQARGGFQRLAEFQKKEGQKKVSHQSFSVKVNKAYKYLDIKEETENSLGFEINKAA
ncbi:MAG: hypothetical protein KDD61_11335 [Bdellovibrionales bacterium]|nr:hypothetical protein [Bdellovibrionales bacterium]